MTAQTDLEEFLTTSQLAETNFVGGESHFLSVSIIPDFFCANAHSFAERQNIKVVQDPSLGAAAHNPYLLTPREVQEMKEKHNENKQRLQVPRRPGWTRKTTVLELERSERDSFLEWRRGLAE